MKYKILTVQVAEIVTLSYVPKPKYVITREDQGKYLDMIAILSQFVREDGKYHKTTDSFYM